MKTSSEPDSLQSPAGVVVVAVPSKKQTLWCRAATRLLLSGWNLGKEGSGLSESIVDWHFVRLLGFVHVYGLPPILAPSLAG